MLVLALLCGTVLWQSQDLLDLPVWIRHDMPVCRTAVKKLIPCVQHIDMLNVLPLQQTQIVFNRVYVCWACHASLHNQEADSGLLAVEKSMHC